jgi:5-methylcytosine-specific restriction endonuclease McrA
MNTDYLTNQDNDSERFRQIVLFGKNVASYKFALAKCLIEFGRKGFEYISMEELAAPFSLNICEHLKICDRQGTFQSSRFLDACRYYNAGRISFDELRSITVLLGFQNVIDAFHVIGEGNVGAQFFIDERKGKYGGIRLTDSTITMCHNNSVAGDLKEENEARWRLVESAWEANAKNVTINILYDSPRELLITGLRGERRSIVEIRPALNGYQKGYCFYCFKPISIGYQELVDVDVDHFFPFSLMGRGLPYDVDHVWNLVLTCRECNRGSRGKFANIPDKSYDGRLFRRNEWLIRSHHPLRNTLMRMMGNSRSDRMKFISNVRLCSENISNQNAYWRTGIIGDPKF